MRVIAGRFRGYPLAAPPGRTTRPITDQVKETLFNVLGHRFGTLGELPAVDVLDLFAGAGSLGIECLSRGAASCIFVEKDRTALRTLRANLAKLDVGTHASVRVENAWTARLPLAPSGQFGLVFLDPPYRDVEHTTRVIDLLERVAARLAPDGVAVLRHSARTGFPQRDLRLLECVDVRTIGEMRIELLMRRSEPRP